MSLGACVQRCARDPLAPQATSELRHSLSSGMDQLPVATPLRPAREERGRGASNEMAETYRDHLLRRRTNGHHPASPAGATDRPRSPGTKTHRTARCCRAQSMPSPEPASARDAGCSLRRPCPTCPSARHRAHQRPPGSALPTSRRRTKSPAHCPHLSRRLDACVSSR